MPRTPLHRALGLAGKAAVAIILALVVLPAVVVAIASVNATAILDFPPRGLSLRWFERAFAYGDFREGLVNGLIVTGWASSIALAVGAGLAFALSRYAFNGKRALEAILMSPLIIPHFTIGLGLLMLVAASGLPRGFPVVVFCHVVLVLPFVVRSTYISLMNLDRQLELAAASLGAPPGRVLWTVTLPLLAPGLASGWLFAAILSFNEFTATLFVTTQATQTLPVAMYNYVREYADPTLAAISVLYIVATAALLAVANARLGLGKVLNIGNDR